MNTRLKDERGAVAILVGVLATTLFVVAAMVVDLGLARDTRRQAQNAADASALAAANVLWPLTGVCVAHNPSGSATAPCLTDAINAAKEYAADNFGITDAAWAGCIDPGHFWVPTGGTPCISIADSTLSTTQPIKPSKVRVVTPIRSVKTGLGTLAGVSTISVDGVARATVDTELKQPCGLCILGPGDHDFQNGDAVVNGGDIYLNGSSDVSNNGLVASDGSIYVQGTASGGYLHYQPDPTTGVPPIKDPLASVQLPSETNSWYGVTAAGKTNPCVDGPGIYAGWTVQNSTCTLQPGLYVVASGTVDMSGSTAGNLVGSGVTIYLTCGSGNVPHSCSSSGEEGASFDASGNGNVAITAPTSGPLAGIAIAADRHNIDLSGGHPKVRLTGNGTLGMSGAIYTVAGTVEMNGNGCTNGLSSMIVANDIAFNGNNACLTLTYNPDQNPKRIPSNLRLDQ